MNNLIKFQNKMASLLELNGQDLNDFREASDHDKKCKCELCKKWKLIVRGKYKS
jgi:hypothetical protein